MKCPDCGRELRNGELSKLTHEPEDIEAMRNGTITPEEYDSRAYKVMTKVCGNNGNPELEINPCPSFGKAVGFKKLTADMEEIN